MILTISGSILILLGFVISIVFWIPGIFKRDNIKEIMGKRYPLVYVIYIANGPMLILFGFLLLLWAKSQ